MHASSAAQNNPLSLLVILDASDYVIALFKPIPIAYPDTKTGSHTNDDETESFWNKASPVVLFAFRKSCEADAHGKHVRS